MLLQSAQIKVKKLLVDDKITSCARDIGLLGIFCLKCIVFLQFNFTLVAPVKVVTLSLVPAEVSAYFKFI